MVDESTSSLLCFLSLLLFRYLLYITQLINNQETKPHKYSVYIKSITIHPVPVFNKARSVRVSYMKSFSGIKKFRYHGENT